MLFTDFKSNFLNLNKKFKILTIILFLLPISLIVGPASLEPLLFILSVFGVYFFFKNEIRLKLNYFLTLIILFYLVSIISSIFSDYKVFSLKSSLPMIRFFLSIIVISYVLEKNKWLVNFYYIFILYIFLFVLLDGITQAATGYNFVLMQSQSDYLITGFFGNEKVLGRFIFVFMSLLIGFFLSMNIKEDKIKYFSILIFFSISFIIFTSERLSMFYGFIIVLLYIIFLSIFYGKKNLFLFIIPLLILLFFFKFSPGNFFFQKLQGTLLQVTDNKSKIVFFSKEHENFAQTSIELFKKKPIIGVGPKNFRYKCSSITPRYIGTNNCSTHPHNNFFQVLAETGSLGCIFYVLIFFELIKLFIRSFLDRKNIKKFSLIFYLIPTIFYLNPFFPSGNIFNNWNMAIGLVTIPFFIYFKKNNENK